MLYGDIIAMEIQKYEALNIEYVDYEEYLDNHNDLSDDMRLVINGIIRDQIHEIIHYLIKLYCAVETVDESPKYNLELTHDEYVKYKYIMDECQSYLSTEKEYSDEKYGVWKYIDKDIYEIYNDEVLSINKTNLSLDYILNYIVKEKINV